jgi:predicted small metal-binding protein
MEMVISCDCGFSIRSSNEHELIAAAQRHAREVHGVSIAADQALAMAYPAAAEDWEEES